MVQDSFRSKWFEKTMISIFRTSRSNQHSPATLFLLLFSHEHLSLPRWNASTLFSSCPSTGYMIFNSFVIWVIGDWCIWNITYIYTVLTSAAKVKKWHLVAVNDKTWQTLSSFILPSDQTKATSLWMRRLSSRAGFCFYYSCAKSVIAKVGRSVVSNSLRHHGL